MLESSFPGSNARPGFEGAFRYNFLRGGGTVFCYLLLLA